MRRSQRRLLLLAAALPLLLLVAGSLYVFGMAHLEGEPRTFWEGLEWAAETLSTTGYGADVRWEHPAMVLFVVLLQFAGVFLIFLVFPIYLIPVLEERFEARLPTSVSPLADHIVLFGFSPAVALLIKELDLAGLEVLIMESDETSARRLMEQSFRVVHGSLDDGLLENVHLLSAKALIANSFDEQNAAVTLAAREMGFTGDILVLVEEPFHRIPMQLAGATKAYSPKVALGAALATRASRKVNPSVAGVQALGAHLRVREVRVEADSELSGRSLKQVDLGNRTNVTVIGQWLRGHLEAPVSPDKELEPGSILVVVGSDESLRKLCEVCAGTRVFPSSGPFVIAGFGEVGQEVATFLRQAGEDLTVVDRQAGVGVDVVGDVLEAATLRRAGVADAQAVILALDSDSATLFAILILENVAPGVPIFARVNRASNLDRIHRAGAEFAQALSEVSSRILARRLIGRASLALDPQLEILQVDAGRLAGHPPKGMGIRESTGCSVVAVERGDQLFTHFRDDFIIEPRDHVYICGARPSIREFQQRY